MLLLTCTLSTELSTVAKLETYTLETSSGNSQEEEQQTLTRRSLLSRPHLGYGVWMNAGTDYREEVVGVAHLHCVRSRLSLTHQSCLRQCTHPPS